MSRLTSITRHEGDPGVVRLIARLEPPASPEEVRAFSEGLHNAGLWVRVARVRLVGGARGRSGFDVRNMAATDSVEETIRVLRELIESSKQGG